MMLRARTLIAAFVVAQAIGCGGGDDGTMRAVPTGPVGGEERPVEVIVPTSYDPRRPAPLLLLLHSYTVTGALAEAFFQFAPIAEERGFLYAIPNGLTDDFMNAPFWNANAGCCDFDRSAPDDSAYLRRVIEDIMARWNVDRRRIFTFGLSNGGFMGHRLACDHADLLAGIVSVAGATHQDRALCAPSDGIHILDMHGTEDRIIHYDGGIFSGPYPGAEETVSRWVALNDCRSSEPGPNVDADARQPGAETIVTRFTACRRGASVEAWKMVGSGHFFLPTDEFKELLFDYFESHPKD